jgi:hypothetical protein
VAGDAIAAGGEFLADPSHCLFWGHACSMRWKAVEKWGYRMPR